MMASNGKLTIKAARELARDPARLVGLSDAEIYEIGRGLPDTANGRAAKWMLYAAHDLVVDLRAPALEAIDWRMANPSADWNDVRAHSLHFVIQAAPNRGSVRVFLVGNKTFNEITRAVAGLLGYRLREAGGSWWLKGLTPYYAEPMLIDLVRVVVGLGYRPLSEAEGPRFRIVSDIVHRTTS